MIEFMVEIVSDPWRRVKTPVELPAQITAQQLLQLDDVEFSELLRSNLYPRPGEQLRARWEGLWRIIRGNDDVADRALDVFDEWEDRTLAAVTAGLPEADTARVNKFLTALGQARARVDVDTGSALGWAGVGAKHPEGSQRVINRLVQAIHRHRIATGADATPADHELWRVLRTVKLDPNDYQ